jgi:hypothetical protein
MTERLGPLWMALAAIVAAVCALGASAVLRAIATPQDYQARGQALENQTRRIEALAKAPGNDAAFPKGAVCDSIESQAPIQLRDALEQAASAQSLRRVQISLGEATEAGGKLAPIPLRLEAEGSYEGVLNWLDQARRLTPTIFVDTTDLSAAGPDTHLTMVGRVFCWTRG